MQRQFNDHWDGQKWWGDDKWLNDAMHQSERWKRMAADGKKYSSKSVENGGSEFRNFCKTLNMIEKERKKRTEILKVLIYD